MKRRFLSSLFVVSLACNLATGILAGYYVYTRYVSPPAWWTGVPDNSRAAFFAACPASPGATIIAGDSNIQRGMWQELLGLPILNRGIDGDNTAALLARVAELARHDPTAVVLLVGNNDAGRVPLTESIDNYADILSSLEPRAGRIIVVSIIPRDTRLRSARYGLSNDDNREFNRRLAQLCKERGCIFLDLFDEMLGANGQLDAKYHTGDGNHLSAVGYRFVAEKIKPLLVSDGR
jgi:lysophospholipase L1-like esterase